MIDGPACRLNAASGSRRGHDGGNTFFFNEREEVMRWELQPRSKDQDVETLAMVIAETKRRITHHNIIHGSFKSSCPTLY